MWQHEPLKLVLAVGCKFSIHTKLDILPTCMLVHPRSPDHTQTSGVSTPKSSLAVIQIGMWQKCALTPFHPHTPFSQGKKHRGDTWLSLKAHLGTEAAYGGRWMSSDAPGSWQMSRGLAVQNMQSNVIQSAWHGVHTKLKGKCQFFLILTKIKAENCDIFETRLEKENY